VADYAPILEGTPPATYTVGATAVTGGDAVYLSATAGSNSNGTVLTTTAATVAFVGVAAHDAAIGARVTVLSGGIQEMTSGGSITFGTSVKTGASGRVVTWVSGTDAADLAIGLALTGTGAAGNPVRVKLYR
jgi:hypothetical protein